MENVTVRQFIKNKERELENAFPVEAMYSSRMTLWNRGRNSGMVTDDEVIMAKAYYGKLWNYVGD